MLIKDLVDEVFQDYKYPSMYIAMPYCNMKCCIEYGTQICQNNVILKQKNADISYKNIIDRYNTNPITKAIIFSGLEPFDSFDEIFGFIKYFRETNQDDVVIYTGYNKYEIQDLITMLSLHKNIIVKYGRYVPNQNSHYDDILGVNLSSQNQYAERL